MVAPQNVATFLDADLSVEPAASPTAPPPPSHLPPHGHGGPQPLTNVFVQDVDGLSTSSYVFFSVVVPALFKFFLVFTAFLVLTWVWIRLWMFFLWKCSVSDNWIRLTAYCWAILLGFAGFWLAFASIGIDFTHIFFGFGFLAIVFSAGCMGTISNFASGMRLQLRGLYANHELIRLRGYNNFVGTIESMNVFDVVMRPEPVEGDKTNEFVADSVIVPNTVFTDFPVDVIWSKGKTPDYGAKPSRMHPLAMPTKQTVDVEAALPVRHGNMSLSMHAKRILDMQRQTRAAGKLSYE